MLAWVAPLLFLTVVTGQGMAPCCHPKKMTVDVLVMGNKNTESYTMYVDFDRNLGLEMVGSAQINYRMVNMNTKTLYTRKADGTCRLKNVKKVFDECMPSTAKFVNYFGDLALFQWKEGKKTVQKMVTKTGCLPYFMATSRKRQTTSILYTNAKASLDDPTILDKDVSDCQSRNKKSKNKKKKKKPRRKG